MKNKAAQQLGKRGGKARAASLSKEQRSEIARNAANARWLQQCPLCGSFIPKPHKGDTDRRCPQCHAIYEVA